MPRAGRALSDTNQVPAAAEHCAPRAGVPGELTEAVTSHRALSCGWGEAGARAQGPRRGCQGAAITVHTPLWGEGAFQGSVGGSRGRTVLCESLYVACTCEAASGQ